MKWRLPSLQDLLIFGTALVGLAALALSSLKDWFVVPITDGQLVSETIQPSIVPLFQATALIIAILLAASWVWQRRWNQLSVAIASVWLLILFTFPYTVMVHDPPIAARATWLQMQHDNLIWLGGDINTSQEMSRYGWKSHVYVVDAPRQLAVIRMPNWSAADLDINRLSQLIEWLGFTNAFCQFVSKGWYLGCVGGVAMLISTFFARRESHTSSTRKRVDPHRSSSAGDESTRSHVELVCWRLDTKQVACALVILPLLLAVYCIAAWSVPARASGHLSDSAQLCVVGEYQDSLDALFEAARVLPILREDTYYVAQRGLLESRLGIESEFSALYKANQLERESFYQQALQMYRESSGGDATVRREATRALLRYSVQAINSGNTLEAIELLREILRLEPSSLKALYMLQIASLRSDDDDGMREAVQRMYAICEHLRFPTKRVLLATSQQHSMYAAMLNGEVQAAWEHSAKMKRP